MKKQYSIPDEVMTATARVLQNYRQRLEGEIKILVRASATPAQMDELVPQDHGQGLACQPLRREEQHRPDQPQYHGRGQPGD